MGLFISEMDLNLRVLLDYINDIKVRILHLLNIHINNNNHFNS